MVLRDKIKKSAISLGLAGLLAVQGCGAAMSGLGVYGGGRAGLALVAMGQGVSQIEAAEAGRSQVNVNTVNNEIGNTNYGQRKDQFFACNYWRGDLNGNNVPDLNECFNIKDEFYIGENMTLVGEINNRTGAQIDFQIYKLVNNKKNKVGSPKSFQCEGDYLVTICKNIKIEETGLFLYTWKIGGENLGSVLIECCEREGFNRNN